MKKVNALLWRLDNLKDRIISMIHQERFRKGAKINKNKRTVNPESIRLNPKIKSYFPPTKRTNGNWVKKIVIPLKIFSFSS